MQGAIRDLAALLASLAPTLHEGVYVYTVVPADVSPSGLAPVASVREPEGLTLVVPEAQAVAAGLPVVLRVAWITLTVHSDLQAVGLTAAFAGALGRAGVSCNVVAGAYHDHLFVPVEQAALALAVLQDVQRTAQADVARTTPAAPTGG